MIYVLAESWSLCDLRDMRGPMSTADAAAAACRTLSLPEGSEIAPDGLTDVADKHNRIGAWFTAQSGMCTTHDSREEACRWLRAPDGHSVVGDIGGRLRDLINAEQGVGPIYLGRICRVVAACRARTEAVIVVIECDPADVIDPAPLVDEHRRAWLSGLEGCDAA